MGKHEHVYCTTMAFTDDLIFTQFRKEDIKLNGCWMSVDVCFVL